MITDNIKNALAKANGLERERYISMVNEKGKQAYTAEEENALLRKIVYVLLQKELERSPSISAMKECTEYLSYNDFYEATKTEARTALNIITNDDVSINQGG